MDCGRRTYCVRGEAGLSQLDLFPYNDLSKQETVMGDNSRGLYPVGIRGALLLT